jgi:hypothetical protein
VPFLFAPSGPQQVVAYSYSPAPSSSHRSTPQKQEVVDLTQEEQVVDLTNSPPPQGLGFWTYLYPPEVNQISDASQRSPEVVDLTESPPKEVVDLTESPPKEVVDLTKGSPASTIRSSPAKSSTGRGRGKRKAPTKK